MEWFAVFGVVIGFFAVGYVCYIQGYQNGAEDAKSEADETE